MEKVKEIVTEEVTEEKVEERPEEVEIQTTFNEDSMDVLCEDADIENEEKEVLKSRKTFERNSPLLSFNCIFSFIGYVVAVLFISFC